MLSDYFVIGDYDYMYNPTLSVKCQNDYAHNKGDHIYYMINNQQCLDAVFIKKNGSPLYIIYNAIQENIYYMYI